SWRDLPLLINQWCNIVRWEMRTRLFLRTTEFLWQEGHTAHATEQEAVEEAERMLGVYATFAEDWIGLPVIRGVKTASERFAGAIETYCIESLMQDGKALQAGTSHFLGQNFAKAFDVKFDDSDNQRSGWKFAEYELRGVPIRLGIGMRDLENGTVEVARRDTLTKESRSLNGITEYIKNLLDEIQVNIYQKALKFREENTHRIDTWGDFKIQIELGGFILAHWYGT